jgi:cellular nucleic acid-binding protein
MPIYILKLQHGKYYVGKSVDPIKRYQEHLAGAGSSWTRLHNPVSLLETRPERSPLDEDTVTKEYMFKYGIDNVRGGSYVTTELSAAQHTALQTEFRSARGLCTRCGQSGHFVKDCCTDEEESESEEEVWECNTCEKEFENYNTCVLHQRICSRIKPVPKPVIMHSMPSGCFRCGRTSHFAKDCYASTVVSHSIRSSSCFRCGRDSHFVKDCYARTDKYGNRI